MDSEPEIKGQFPGGIDPAIMHLVGTIVTWWARIEGILIFDLVGLRQHRSCAEFARRHRFPGNTRQIIEQWADLRQLAYADNPGKLSEALELCPELLGLSRKRNELVHSFWPYGSNAEGKKLRLQSIKRRRGSHAALDFDTVEIDAHKLDLINETLVRLYHRVMISSLQLLTGPDRIVDPATAGGGFADEKRGNRGNGY